MIAPPVLQQYSALRYEYSEKALIFYARTPFKDESVLGERFDSMTYLRLLGG
jgi:hypothetical protein